MLELRSTWGEMARGARAGSEGGRAGRKLESGRKARWVETSTVRVGKTHIL